MVLGGSRMTGAVRPPRPLEGFRNVEPEYPFSSRQRGEQGVVGVVLSVSEVGQVTAVEIAQSSGYPALDEAVRRVAPRWRYHPATREDGTPIPGTVRTAVHFRLPRQERSLW